MEDCPKPIEIKDIKNKEKKIEIKCNNNKLFNVCFLNQGNYLLINTYYNDEFNKFVFEKKIFKMLNYLLFIQVLMNV